MRDETRASFLAQAGWDTAACVPLAGDASSRRYFRLQDDRFGQAILMDADPAQGQNIGRFLKIARWFGEQGLSAPEILAADEIHGFAIVEDLGDALLSDMTTADPNTFDTLFGVATDVLAHLAGLAPPDFLSPIAPTYINLAASAWDWYAAGLGRAAQDGKDSALACLSDHLETLSALSNVVIHRDWHAGNLLWLPDRIGTRRIGILDFQDAVTGHVGYDLVSMTRDARRIVPEAVHQAGVAQFAAALNLDRAEFARDCAVLAVQRNLRILGIFARLSLRFSKHSYVDFIPILWQHLINDLASPGLEHLRAAILGSLPEPTSENLARLKALCGTAPTL